VTATGRSDLILAAARSIADTRSDTSIESLLGDAGTLDLADASEFAADGVLEALYPDEFRRITAARRALGDAFIELEGATRDVTFAIGIAYGRLIAKAEAKVEG
jgi:hypothetical protein